MGVWPGARPAGAVKARGRALVPGLRRRWRRRLDQIRVAEMPMHQGPIPVEFGMFFPDGAYAAGKFEMVRDFDRSSGDRVVQQIDRVTGLPLWVVEVIDADEAARQRTVKVKVAAQVQPVLPSPAPGSPFTAVEFEGLMATPHVDSSRCQGKGKDKCGARWTGCPRERGDGVADR